MNPNDFDSAEDRRLSALLRAPQAEANPAVWARVRTRLAAEARPAIGRFDGLLDWLMRPAAMAAATVALVVSLGAGWNVVGSLTTTDTTLVDETTSVMESLLEPSTTATTGDDAGDAGSAAPGDSGVRS